MKRNMTTGPMVLASTALIWVLLAAGGNLLHADSAELGAVRITGTSSSASAVLQEKGKPASFYSPAKAIDGRMETAWCVGPGKWSGAWIRTQFAPATANVIAILNGYGRNKTLYLANNRIKDYEITLFLISGRSVTKRGTLRDNSCEGHGGRPAEEACGPLQGDYGVGLSGQNITLGADLREKVTIRGYLFKILSVYPGKKFQDTCIAEIAPGIYSGPETSDR